MRHWFREVVARAWPVGLLAGTMIAMVITGLGQATGGASPTGSEVPNPRRHPAMVDALGDTLPAGPAAQRIVSLSPNLTEALLSLGVSPRRLVGRTRYCDYPPAALASPDVGGIIDPSLERIQEARPDLVVVARGNPIDLQEQIRALGIPLFAFDDRSDLEGIGDLLAEIDRLVLPDQTQKAESLLARFEHQARAFSDWAEAIPRSERPRVYFADPDNPGFTAGPGSHIDDLIRNAGGRNVVTEGGAWPRYSNEALLVAAPEHLLLALPPGRTLAQVLEQLRKDPIWGALPAVKQGSVCVVEAGMLLRPGPRSIEVLERIAGWLHGDRSRPESR
ncbi:MAG: ABC transporter substrate-binding protein [Candidatus Eisenbacteria bacterium]|nr:ABC transporter substrate-binding protein [Candidatus Eisenbacteria bacterium]